MGFSPTQKAMAIAPKFTGFLSICSSTFIAQYVLRDRKRRNLTVRREEYCDISYLMQFLMGIWYLSSPSQSPLLSLLCISITAFSLEWAWVISSVQWCASYLLGRSLAVKRFLLPELFRHVLLRWENDAVLVLCSAFVCWYNMMPI